MHAYVEKQKEEKKRIRTQRRSGGFFSATCMHEGGLIKMFHESKEWQAINLVFSPFSFLFIQLLYYEDNQPSDSTIINQKLDHNHN